MTKAEADHDHAAIKNLAQDMLTLINLLGIGATDNEVALAHAAQKFFLNERLGRGNKPGY